LEAGTRNNANAYVNVAGSYPKFRPRSGIIESVSFRVNDCLQRSLDGKKLDTISREMAAMVAYIKWTAQAGNEVSKILPGTAPLPLLSRAASVTNGKNVFEANCISCHGRDGQGQSLDDSSGYRYPPLWGAHSYNVSAGMFMISKLASFIKYNMPYTEQQGPPILTDEQSWDVAAYINSQPRPQLRFPEDWPKLTSKPYDYPFGPYADSYTAVQHKYGPYAEIKDQADKRREKNK
jgi:thiosulfate dehydrogenase